MINSFRLTDYGSKSLSNIYGNQDADTLENVLNNVPNIVPKITELIARSGAKHKFSESSPLEIINEDENHVAFNISSLSDVFVEERRAGDGGRSYDTVDETVRVKRQSDLQTSKSDEKIEVDVHGCYSNPIQTSPTVETKEFESDLSASKGTGHSNIININDSVDIVSRASVGFRVNRGRPESAMSSDSSFSPGPKRLIHQKSSIGDDVAYSSSEDINHTPTTSSECIALDSVDTVQSQPTTLHTFLKNVDEKPPELAHTLDINSDETRLGLRVCIQ